MTDGPGPGTMILGGRQSGLAGHPVNEKNSKGRFILARGFSRVGTKHPDQPVGLQSVSV
jgi:hypothetical protein